MKYVLSSLPSFSCSPTNYFGLPSFELLTFAPELWTFAFSQVADEFLLEPFTVPFPNTPLPRHLTEFAVLGKGGQATVHMVYLEGRYAALKIVKRIKDSGSMRAKNESDLNKYLKETGADDHHIALFDETWSGPDIHCFLMPLYSRTLWDLSRDSRQWERAVIVIWVSQLFDAVRFLHRKGIVHRDIKSENIFQDWNGHLLIGDLGLSARNVESTEMFWPGTWESMAPEVLDNIILLQNRRQSLARHLRSPYKADVWGLGTVLYELVEGKTLIPVRYSRNAAGVRSFLLKMDWYRQLKLGRGRWPHYASRDGTNDLLDLVLGLLDPNPSRRTTLRAAVQHPVFSNKFNVWAKTDVPQNARPPPFVEPPPETGIYYELPQSEWSFPRHNNGPEHRFDEDAWYLVHPPTADSQDWPHEQSNSWTTTHSSLRVQPSDQVAPSG